MYSKARWSFLLSASVAIMSLYINMIVFAPILGEISSSLHVDIGSATNLMMGFVLSVACVLIWGGVVCDKFGITTALILGLLCTSVPTVLMPLLGQSFSAVFIGRLVQGASVGFVFATIGPILALWFPPKEQGLAAGVLFGSISLGSTIGVVASPVLLKTLGSWEMVVAVMSIPGWTGIVLAYLFTRQAPSPEVIKALQTGMASGKNDLTVKQALALPKTIVVTAVIVCNAWALYCLYNLVPPFLSAPAPMG
jgi:MFS family permease